MENQSGVSSLPRQSQVFPGWCKFLDVRCSPNSIVRTLVPSKSSEESSGLYPLLWIVFVAGVGC